MKATWVIVLSAIALTSCGQNPPEPSLKPQVLTEGGPLVGAWVLKGYVEDEYVLMSRVASLEPDNAGLLFRPTGDLVERKNSGWCGTPPITYADFPGSWERSSETIVRIQVGYWGGCESYDMEIAALSDTELKFRRLNVEFVDQGRLFFTSFESPQDTAGWPKYGGLEFSTDVPADGGSQSVEIAGGCIHPHAALEIKGPSYDSYVKLECWGKNLAVGGGLSLSRVDGRSAAIHIAVTERDWRQYTTADSLFCPAGERLRIEMAAGGIVASAMLVDLVAVRAAR